MTRDEESFLRCYRILRNIYPHEELVICCKKTYEGYNLSTGKKIILKEVEVDDKC